MSRSLPYVGKPSEGLRQRLSDAANARLFVVHAPGPTSFVLRPDGSERKFRVSIGSVHTCTCGAREQPCVHVAFVMIRVFRLTADDHRTWQPSLLDSELEALVDSRERHLAAQRVQARAFERVTSECACSSGCSGDAGAKVARIPIDPEEGECCPICYEEMTVEEEEQEHLDWCKLSCGKSVHRRCLQVWSDHQSSIGKALTCPFCRGNWAAGTLSAPAAHAPRARGRATATLGAAAAAVNNGPVHRLARCRACRSCPIYGTRYRCLVCKERVELCGDCFNNGLHSGARHPFAKKARPGALWSAAPVRTPAPAVGAAAAEAAAEAAQVRATMPAASAPPDPNLADGQTLARALAELQMREIGPEDYDLLLALSSAEAAANTAANSAANGGSGNGGGGGRRGGGAPTHGGAQASGRHADDGEAAFTLDANDAEAFTTDLVAALNAREAEARAPSAAPAANVRSCGGRGSAFGATTARPWQRQTGAPDAGMPEGPFVSLGLEGSAVPLTAAPNRALEAPPSRHEMQPERPARVHGSASSSRSANSCGGRSRVVGGRAALSNGTSPHASPYDPFAGITGIGSASGGAGGMVAMAAGRCGHGGRDAHGGAGRPPRPGAGGPMACRMRANGPSHANSHPSSGVHSTNSASPLPSFPGAIDDSLDGLVGISFCPRDMESRFH